MKVLKVAKILGLTLVIVLVIALASAGVYSRIGNSSVEAHIKGLGTKLVLITYETEDGRHIKPGLFINNEVKIALSVSKPTKVLMRVLEKRRGFRSRRINFHIEPDENLILKGESENLSIDYRVLKGNRTSRQYAELRKELLPFYIQESEFWIKSKRYRTVDEKLSMQFQKQFDSVRFKVTAQKRTSFVKRHPTYEALVPLLLESHVPKDTTIKYFALLSENAKESIQGQMVQAVIDGWKNTEINSPAPPFSKETSKGRLFKLGKLKGKYVVLDFWGTWCAPCMYGMPKMKRFYDMYNDKFEFVGVACHDKKAAWRKVIEKNQMNWIQVLNDDSGKDIALLYGVTGYPTKFILDREGNIISKFVGETDEFYNEIKKLALKE